MQDKDSAIILRKGQEINAFPGPGGYKIEWSPGTKLVPMIPAPSGHLVIPCDHFDGGGSSSADPTEHMAFCTDRTHPECSLPHRSQVSRQRPNARLFVSQCRRRMWSRFASYPRIMSMQDKDSVIILRKGHEVLVREGWIQDRMVFRHKIVANDIRSLWTSRRPLRSLRLPQCVVERPHRARCALH